MRVLYVAYPLLPVTENSAGGAEQMLWTLEREIAARASLTTVAACSRSSIAGELFTTGDPPAESDAFDRRDAEHCAKIVELVLRREGSHDAFDLIHDKSGSFWRYAGALKTPVLATLHLPRHMYRSTLFENISPNVFFNCVSISQAQSFRDLPRYVGAVPNGIAIERFPFQRHKGDYLLWIGRVCEEKAPHIAINVAQRAGVPLLMAGAVYPFRYHQEYFAREIAPRLSEITYIDWPSFQQKLELLQQARAVLLTSTVDETSSLVAMEAMACGTPVVAFRRGAFPEVVADGVTGFIVNDTASMADSLARVNQIRPEACRERVERDFSATCMAHDYEALYATVLAVHTLTPKQNATLGAPISR
jgi:glycosyltransferase involved in cell wall biosynthesis